MTVLVDYDNIADSHTRKGIQFLTDSIISLIDPSYIANPRIVIRFYGGWYEKKRSTSRSQNLEADIRQIYPTTTVLSDRKTKVVVQCELAYGIMADPKFHLVYTFREKGIPSGLKAHHPIKEGCHDVDCPLIHFQKFIQEKKCPKCGHIKPEDVLYRGEQKLVDSMIITDMLHESLKNKFVCIVSSDDDFWPGIRASIINGCKIVHINTQNSPNMSLYTSGIESHYIRKQL
ncbi:MAG: hypothetical protein LBR68_01365 [Lachnoclostridium sp.]|jgi:uncharacterized LabA/DUF88 family protein|nr:hypothetical protein [Lachnoclostridium sp.]